MAPMTFRAFELEALERGFDEVLERKWEPRAIQGAHIHPFAVEALVALGEMWLTVNDVVRQLRPAMHLLLRRTSRTQSDTALKVRFVGRCGATRQRHLQNEPSDLGQAGRCEQSYVDAPCPQMRSAHHARSSYHGRRPWRCGLRGSSAAGSQTSPLIVEKR